MFGDLTTLHPVPIYMFDTVNSPIVNLISDVCKSGQNVRKNTILDNFSTLQQ